VFGGQVDMIIDGGDSAGGVASTVLDLTGDVPRILRQGAISAEAISKVCGFEVQS
jgi:L-threonylcarbamoyladenylate synthase